MPKIKKDCHWYDDVPKPKCGILGELMCDKKERCSFYETEEQFRTRQKRFAERTGRTQKTKQCRQCREVKDIIEFGMKNLSSDGRDYYCRDCSREMAKMRYKKRRENK